MKKRVLAGLFLLMLMVVPGVTYWFFKNAPKDNRLEESTAAFIHQETGAALRYPEALVSSKQLSDKDQQEKIVFRATEKLQNSPFLATLRYEEGLRIAASLAKVDTIELVLDGANKANPVRYPDYKKVSERRFQQDGKEAAEIIFTYTGLSKEVVKQRLILIAKDDNTAFYLALQSREDAFDKQNSTIFEIIASSLKF